MMRLLVLTAVCAFPTTPQVCATARAAAPPVQTEPQRVKPSQASLEKGAEAVKKARERGAATAARDIKAGRPVILYYGRPWSQGKPLVDAKEQLRYTLCEPRRRPTCLLKRTNHTFPVE